ncbi:MAG TPA: TIGR03013 family XrtA/PEP-CTERM system glycosyltransferase [Dissulfurispiraceae bacterium]
MNTRLTVLISGDVILSVLAVYSGLILVPGNAALLKELLVSESARIFLFVLTMAFSSFFVELYNREKSINKKEVLIRILTALFISFFLLSSLYYMAPSVMLRRGTLLLALGAFGLFQFLWHIGYKVCIHIPGIAKRVIILGTGPLAKQIGAVIASTSHHYVLSGYVNCASEPVYVPSHYVVGNGDGLVETARKEKAHKIVISLTERRGTFPLRDVLRCKFSGIEVVDAPSFYEQMTGKLLIENITPSWFIFSNGFRINSFTKLYKRMFDVVLAAGMLMLALPLFPLIALLIRAESKAPVLFRQVRVGQGERLFVLFKFRTMRSDAESKTGAVWAQKDDPRITKVGRFLRKSRLDELPQLYNVLKGDMTFIGPRPERPEFVEKLKKIIPYYSERHAIKPGITGWAQVKYPYGASVEDAIEKLRYDLFYIKHISLFLDLLIILETVKVVLFGRGGR